MPQTLKISIVLIFLIYLVFGSFFLDIPSVRSDELWETSRAYYLKNNLHPGEPLLPKDIAPFFATIQELGWKSWFIGSLKFGTSAIVMSVLPVDPLQANRLNGFLWSISVCVFTFLLAKKFSLDNRHALLSAACLIVLPEFFQQIHFERAEMLLGSLFLLGWLMLDKGFQAKSEKHKRLWLLVTGLYAWLPSLLVHASGIIIPATLGVLYLVKMRKNIFSAGTMILGIGLAGGMLFFLHISESMSAYAESMGGTDFYDKHACPPIVCEGWKYLLGVPAMFYKKFVKANLFTQPVSALVYIVATGHLIYSIWKQRKTGIDEKALMLLFSIVVPLLIMLLLSGSYGNYNLIAAPFVVITIARLIKSKNLLLEPASRYSGLIPLLMVICLATNAVGMKAQREATHEFKRINSELRKTIPANAKVIGMALYYLPFRDQDYYSVTWMQPSVGKQDLTFEKVIRMKKINYIIADDAFASRANYRGNEWADSLVSFLETNTEMIRQIEAKMYLRIVPDSSAIPVQFRYAGYEKNYVKRIRIYKVKDELW